MNSLIASGLAVSGLCIAHYFAKKNEDDYFKAGYRFKFFIANEPVEATEEELDLYSDKLSHYESFVKRYATRDVKVFLPKEGEGEFAAGGDYITVPNGTLLPDSLLDRIFLDKEARELFRKVYSNEKSNEAALLHEVGHIESNHYKKQFLIGIPMVALATVSTMKSLKGNYTLCPVLLSYFLFFTYKILHHEYEADEFAVKNGYGRALIERFKILIEINKKSNSIFCTKYGEDLRDIWHPSLRNRIANIERLMKEQ